MKTTETNRFAALDGWRGVCALIVALVHWRVVDHLHEFGLVMNAYLFVDFFFVLSGFVLCHAYGNKIVDARSFFGYAIRRFGRLWPLHAAVLFAFVLPELAKWYLVHFHGAPAGTAPFTDRFSGYAFVTNLFLVDSLNLHGLLTWNGPSWSISAEFYTCLIFGALAAAVPGRWLSRVCIAVSAIAALLLVSHAPEDMDVTHDYAIFRCFYGFFAGCCTYWLAQKLDRFDFSSGAMRVAEWATVLSVGVFVSLAGNHIFSFAAPLLFAVAVLVFSREQGAFSRLLNTLPFQKLGEWSYSIYMVHALVVVGSTRFAGLLEFVFDTSLLDPQVYDDGSVILYLQFGDRWIMDLSSLAYLIVVIVLSAATYRWIEVPARRYFNSIARQKIDRRQPVRPATNPS